MCEAAVYMLKAGEEELILQDVDVLEAHSDHIKIINLFGEERVIQATVKRLSLLDHKIFIEAC